MKLVTIGQSVFYLFFITSQAAASLEGLNLCTMAQDANKMAKTIKLYLAYTYHIFLEIK